MHDVFLHLAQTTPFGIFVRSVSKTIVLTQKIPRQTTVRRGNPSVNPLDRRIVRAPLDWCPTYLLTKTP
jgi:hypothetical protein